MEFDKYKIKGAYHWQQFEDGKIYATHVSKVMSWVRKGRTLDVGAGDGVLTHFLHAAGIDDNECAVALAQARNCNVKLGTAYDLQGEYDNVLLSDVLEHLEFPEKALEQVKKVLAPGGLVYIVTPPPIRKTPRKYHYQEWTADELIAFMNTNGFNCTQITVMPKLIRIYGVFELQT